MAFVDKAVQVMIFSSTVRKKQARDWDNEQLHNAGEHASLNLTQSKETSPDHIQPAMLSFSWSKTA
jgi:hypothetical protein